MLVYLVHPAVIAGVHAVSGVAGFGPVLNDSSIGRFLAVLAGSFAVSLLIEALLRRRGRGSPTDRTWAELDLDALAHNVRFLRRVLPARCRIMAVVKANAYGHGDVALARQLGRLGVRAFAVATLDEAVRLRRKLLRGDILILGYTPPSAAGRLRFYA
jgi:serine/alanine racemase